jgi:RimJ/RimL family protein N-acetyltransferase
MNLTYKILETPTLEELNLIEKWRNDPKIKYLTSVHKCEEDLKVRTTQSSLIEEYSDNQDTFRYLIILDKQPIGEINYQWNSRHLIKKIGKTAWAGIVIGETTAQSKGIGTQALNFLEEQIIHDKADRIELGVFEFNKPALGLYLKSGYKEIGRISNLTYWNGRLWDSIQLEKNLN